MHLFPAGTTTIGSPGAATALTINSPTILAANVTAQASIILGNSSSNRLAVAATAAFAAPVLLTAALTGTTATLSGLLTANSGLSVTGTSTLAGECNVKRHLHWLMICSAWHMRYIPCTAQHTAGLATWAGLLMNPAFRCLQAQQLCHQGASLSPVGA